MSSFSPAATGAPTEYAGSGSYEPQAALHAQTNAAILARQRAIATVLAAMESHADPVIRALCRLFA